MSNARAYFVSFSPHIWQPPGVEVEQDRNHDGAALNVIGRFHYLPFRAVRHGEPTFGSTYDASGSYHGEVNFLGDNRLVHDDSQFDHAQQTGGSDLSDESEVQRHFAGQRLLRQHVLGLEAAHKSPYASPLFISGTSAHALAEKFGGTVHDLELDKDAFKRKKLQRTPHGLVLLHAGDPGGSRPLVTETGLHKALEHQLIASQVYGKGPQAEAHLHKINQRYWPVLTEHADNASLLNSYAENPSDEHPHAKLLGKTLRSKPELLAPSHGALMGAGGHVTELYKMARAQPQNATHRMVLADALEDQGNHDAAGFFRSTLPPEAPAKMSRKAGNQETPLRYDRAGMLGMLDRIAKGAGSIYDRVMQGLGRKSSPKSAFFKPPEQAMAQAEHNVGAAEEAEQMLAQQQQDAMNSHVLDNIHRNQSTRRGGTLEQGRSYPMRQGGMHSAETNAALHGECSDAGRRLNECKGDGRYGTHSGRGARL